MTIAHFKVTNIANHLGPVVANVQLPFNCKTHALCFVFVFEFEIVSRIVAIANHMGQCQLSVAV